MTKLIRTTALVLMLSIVSSTLLMLAQAQPIIATIPVGDGPFGVGVNSGTNMIYVANTIDDTVSVINGVTNTVVGLPISVGDHPEFVGVNPITNMIYVANANDDTVSVINGVTNTVVGLPISVGPHPNGVGVTPGTNMIYVANANDDTVSVINGVTNTVVGLPISVGDYPIGVGVNPGTNRIYVANYGDNTVSVIDGFASTVIATITVGVHPRGVGVNPGTNMIYVANADDDTVSVIDGVTNTVIDTIPVGDGSSYVGVNPGTNRIYVTNIRDDTVSGIDGSTNTVTNTITVGDWPLGVGVNPGTNMIYVANTIDDTVSVIDGSTYELTIEVVGTGTTDPAPGTYTIDRASDVTVEATTDPCWTFLRWELDGVFVSVDPSITVPMDDDHRLTAFFVEKTYELTIEVDGGGDTDPHPGTHTYDCSEDVDVTFEESDPCWTFDHWMLDGAPVGHANPYTVTMDDDHALTAVFERIQYDVTIEVVGSGDTDPAPGTHTRDCCTDFTVTAIETDGPFDHWDLDGCFFSDEPCITVHVDADHTLTAVFLGWDVALTAEKEGYSDVSDFGVRPDATNCFDPAYDELDQPAPPEGVVSYFWYPCCPSTPVDQRKLAKSKIAPAPLMTWTYKVKPVAIDGEMCISWSAGDIASIPPELPVYLHCPDCSVINMRTETEYCFTAESDTTYTFTIGVGGCDFELHLSAGWNMVSLPCLPDDPSFSNIMCGVDFYQVLTWDGTSYVKPDTAEAGQGYWILVLADTTVTLANYNPVESYELDLPAGWSMIGSISTCTVDADCVFPDYYRLYTWDGTSYVAANTIEPGKGYWALVLESTHIIVADSCCTP